MKRPPENEEPLVEGRVFRFPRLWVPPDGIEPLNESPVETEASNGVGSELESPIDAASQGERTAFEAGEFWERGDTQEFVGVAASQASPPTGNDDADAITGAGGEEMSRLSPEPRRTSHNGAGIAVNDATPDSGRATFSARYAWARAAGAAVLVLGVLIGGGIALAAALHSPPQPHRQAASARVEGRHVASQGTRLATTGTLVLPAVNRGRPVFAPTHRASTSAFHGSARAAHPAPPVSPLQQVRYVQPRSQTSTPAPSALGASSSGGSSSGVRPQSQPPSYSRPQHSAPAPQAPRASPSGALTCISNCG